jgi:4a-hydroxytetrahydrobiopterin dehydratase
MTDLHARRCRPWPPGTPPLTGARATELLAALAAGWSVSGDGRSLHRLFEFADYYRTMAFVNAVAWIAHAEDHHPDLEVGYDRCRVSFSTHSVGGLSENDFICAARIDAL